MWAYVLVGSGNTTEGFSADRKYKTGTSGSAYLDRSWTYSFASYQLDGGEAKSTVVRPVIASDRDYTTAVTSGTSGSNLWSYSSTFYATNRLQLALKQIDTTEPAVTTANNGSNSSETKKRYFNSDGTLAFEKSEAGIITYREYTNGQLTKLIEDADTGQTGAGQDFENVSIPTGFSSSGTELHRKTTHTYDAQGRPFTSTANTYTPVTYYSKLGDQRLVELRFTHSAGSSPTTYYGPVGYRVFNHAGRV
ncbi:MAG: hypothetical protein U1E76_06655, partial [Planctomycetota bacterium]